MERRNPQSNINSFNPYNSNNNIKYLPWCFVVYSLRLIIKIHCKKFNRIPGKFFNAGFFLILEKHIAVRGNLFALPRKDFSFSTLEFPLQRCNPGIYGKVSCQGEGKYPGKLWARNQEQQRVFKDLKRIPDWIREYPGKFLSAKRKTNWFERTVGQGNIRENSRLQKIKIFPAEEFGSVIPARSRERYWSFFAETIQRGQDWVRKTLLSFVAWIGSTPSHPHGSYHSHNGHLFSLFLSLSSLCSENKFA